MKEIRRVHEDKKNIEFIDGFIAWGFLFVYALINVWFAFESTCKSSLESGKTHMNGEQLERYFDIQKEDWKEVNCKYHFQCDHNEWNDSYTTYKSYERLKNFTQMHNSGFF